MTGAITREITYSVLGRENIKAKDFPLFDPVFVFTDDTMPTVAVVDCLLHQKDFPETFHQYCWKSLELNQLKLLRALVVGYILVTRF